MEAFLFLSLISKLKHGRAMILLVRGRRDCAEKEMRRQCDQYEKFLLSTEDCLLICVRS
jgi:hypothetical protein